MKYLEINEGFGGAGQCATHVRTRGKGPIPLATSVLLLFTILCISGCTSIANSPKTASSAIGAASISIAPASVSFGSVAVGGTASQSVTITNGGGSNLTVTQASATATGVAITGISVPLTIGAGKQASFNVVFSPKTAGAFSGNVSIMSDVSSSPSTVSLSGLGMAATAVLTMSTSSLSFGNIAVGKKSVLSVILTNAGNSSVAVSKVSVSGAPYSTSGVSSGLILAPGQSATLDATFTPASDGSLTGSVTVASDATNSPATISLSGDGAQADAPSVALKWTPTTSAVAGYNVYRSEISGGPYKKLDSGIVASDTYTDSSVRAGLTYYYVVTAVTSAGMESADSAQTSATVPTS